MSWWVPISRLSLKGRNIRENILLAHELVRNFHRDKKGTPKFCAKLDIRKAYDSVPWDAVLNTLESLKFPEILVRWIRECISKVSFSVMINGSPSSFFRGGAAV